MSNPYLSQIERGLRKPSAEILQAIAKALQISAESLYIKAGILEEREELADLEVAILRDAWLSERQRAALLEIYRSFRHENEERRATKQMGSRGPGGAEVSPACLDAVEPVPPRSRERDFELAEGEPSPGESSPMTGPERQASPT